MSVLGTALFIARLAPEFRAAIVGLVKALLRGDDEAGRQAYEAARRAAFVARQK